MRSPQEHPIQPYPVLARPKPPPRPVPDDVQTGVQLWWGVLAAGLVSMIISLVDTFNDRGTIAADLTRQLAEDNAGRSGDPFTVSPTLVAVMLVVVALVAAAAVVGLGFFAVALRRGKGWGRTIVTLICAFVILGAVAALVSAVAGLAGIGEAETLSQFLAGAVSIVQGVLGAGVIMMLHRKESNKFFLRQPPAR